MKIKILGGEYTVKYVKHMTDGDLGGNDNTNMTITVLDCPQKKTTLMHEALHALIWQTGAHTLFEDDDKEESFISIITGALVLMLAENPELLKTLGIGE